MGRTNAGNLPLVGGHLALDFANTVWWHEAEEPKEWLCSYADLLAWSVHAGALTQKEAVTLAIEASTNPDEAGLVLERAWWLRSVLFRLFRAIARSSEAEDEDIAALNQCLARVLPELRIDRDGAGFEWHWAHGADLWAPFLRVVWAAIEILLSPELDRVGICAGSPCGWLFLDKSRNRSRKWCDMLDCGNRAKAKRHSARLRKQVGDSDSG